ncbi:MAG: penicillin-binding protein 2 [Armatimonadetes bacterium]|nr:penicillin-binding protein 2 [Armatimonadota bacterium]
MERKLFFLKFLIIILFILLSGRLFFIQIIKGDYYQNQAQLNMLHKIPLTAPRGIIYDRNLKILAANSPSFSLFLYPLEVENISFLINKLTSLINLNQKQVKKILKQFVKAEIIKIKDNLDFKSSIKLSEFMGDLPGLHLQVQPLRVYVYNNLAAHTLGYLGEMNLEELKLNPRSFLGEQIGKLGIEEYYDSYLRGESGAQIMQVDVSGKIVANLREEEPKQGDNLFLTIDLELQKICEKALKEKLRELKEHGINSAGVIIVLDAKSGEILALSSLPSFNPNLFVKGISNKEYQDLIQNNFYPLLNRAISAAFPCGSTFKLITASSALQEGICKADSFFYCKGVYYLGNSPFNCFVRGGHGNISFEDAIAKSCDVVFYQLGEKLGINKMEYYARAFGLGEKTGIDLRGEISGLFPNEIWKEKQIKEKWYPGDTVNTAIGQGYLEVTPLQLALITQSVANGGYLYKPFLVKKIINFQGRKVLENYPVLIRKIPVDEKYLKIIKKGMRGAVIYGTAAALNQSGVEIAGKTGTVENFPASGNPYGRNHTWFTCFAP